LAAETIGVTLVNFEIENVNSLAAEGRILSLSAGKSLINQPAAEADPFRF
jgi:hypothetical protein